MPSTVRYFVALDGNDENDGTMENPFASLDRATRAVAEIVTERPPGGVVVMLRSGIYEISETFELTDAHSGTESASVIFAGYPGEDATISGAATLEGLEWTSSGNLHQTDLTDFFNDLGGDFSFNTLFVNGDRATRARSPNINDPDNPSNADFHTIDAGAEITWEPDDIDWYHMIEYYPDADYGTYQHSDGDLFLSFRNQPNSRGWYISEQRYDQIDQSYCDEDDRTCDEGHTCHDDAIFEDWPCLPETYWISSAFSGLYEPCRDDCAEDDPTTCPRCVSPPTGTATLAIGQGPCERQPLDCSFRFHEGDIEPEWILDEACVELVNFREFYASRNCIVEVNDTDNIVTVKIGTAQGFDHDNGLGIGQRYFVENALELVDTEGEWYFRENTNTLYYQTSGSIDQLTFAIPRLDELMRVVDASHIEFHDLTFAYADWTLSADGYGGGHAAMKVLAEPAIYFGSASDDVTVDGTSYITFSNNAIAHVGGTGLRVRGTHTAIRDNQVFDCGGAGIQLGLFGSQFGYSANAFFNTTTAFNEVSGNSVHDNGVVWFESPQIAMSRVQDTLISNNEVYNGPIAGIWIGPAYQQPSSERNNIIEHNEVHHVMRIMTDGGGISTHGRHGPVTAEDCELHDEAFQDGCAEVVEYCAENECRGEIIRFNRVHHITQLTQPFPGYIDGIYFDGGHADILATHNLIYQVETGHVMNFRGTAESRFQNNIVVDSPSAFVALTSHESYRLGGSHVRCNVFQAAAECDHFVELNAHAVTQELDWDYNLYYAGDTNTPWTIPCDPDDQDCTLHCRGTCRFYDSVACGENTPFWAANHDLNSEVATDAVVTGYDDDQIDNLELTDNPSDCHSESW